MRAPSPAPSEAKERPETAPADGRRLDRALGDALEGAASALAAPAGEQLDMLEPRQVAPEWADAAAVDRVAVQVEAGRKRGGRPPGASNKVGREFWAYTQQLGLPSPAIEILRQLQAGPIEMARAMRIEHDKAAELYVRLLLGMVGYQLPKLSSLAVSGQAGTGVNVAFHIGEAGGGPGADGAMVFDGTVGNVQRNQQVSVGAREELESGELEGDGK